MGAEECLSSTPTSSQLGPQRFSSVHQSSAARTRCGTWRGPSRSFVHLAPRRDSLGAICGDMCMNVVFSPRNGGVVYRLSSAVTANQYAIDRGLPWFLGNPWYVYLFWQFSLRAIYRDLGVSTLRQYNWPSMSLYFLGHRRSLHICTQNYMWRVASPVMKFPIIHLLQAGRMQLFPVACYCSSDT